MKRQKISVPEGFSTVMEKLLEDISFNASDLKGQKIIIDARMVRDKLNEILKSEDLSRYIL